MIPENVTLIVKAPNQQIEDQNIECESSWTVRQLKGHLSEVYPNKPRTEEQKIIYSGQLLDDSTILKDVLRTYDAQIAHTMHLVCTPSRKMPEPARNQTTTDSDGLRRRTVENREEAVPHESQNVQNHTVEMQNYLNSAINNYGRVPPYPNYNFEQMPAQDPASVANQMMMMQQAYMQYMQQYALWQASIRAEQPPPAAAPPPAPAEPPAEAEAEDAQPRDWLDHLYAASRLAILFSLIYLYGSGARLLLVIVLAVAGYLHQIGFFRDLNLNGNLRNRNQQGNQPNPQGNQPNQQGNQPNPQGNQPNPQGNQPNPQENQPNQTPPAEANANQPEPDDERSLWSVTWMIFTTFFASLIPDANHQ